MSSHTRIELLDTEGNILDHYTGRHVPAWVLRLPSGSMLQATAETKPTEGARLFRLRSRTEGGIAGLVYCEVSEAHPTGDVS